ncbi:MAG: threonylcarbamoyl-AMP synthase [Desulfosarcina sp.]|nr:threonylcarbamoyl-AMP synthase [Desulfosarcina sp.]
MAARILGQEGILVFPTHGLYGLGADAFCNASIRRVFAVKRRPAHQPLLVLLSGNKDMDRVVRTVPGYAEVLMGLWPGGITVIFEAADTVPVCLTGGTGKIGVRVPAHPVAKALIEQFGGPVTGTSANLSGFPAPARVMDLDPEIRRQADMVLDGGTLAGGPGSTIVDVTCWPVRVLREGVVPRQAIDDVLRKG